MNQHLNKLDLVGQLTGGNFQSFVDNVMATRYNVVQWNKYFRWGAKGMTTQFNAVEATADVLPMASVIDPDAEKPRRALQGISLYSGEIPKIGHGYDLTEKDLRQYYAMIQAGGLWDTKEVMDLLFNTVNKLEFGAHIRINSMAHMILSTGHLVLNATNNPDGGIIKDIDMRIPTANKKYAGWGNGVAVAWTDDTATPLTDLQDMLDYADDNYIPYDGFTIHKKLWRTFMRHPNVVKEVRAKAANTNLTGLIGDQDMKNFLESIGFPTFRIIDEKSGLQTDGVNAAYTSWDESNITLSQFGVLGEVKSATPITVPDPAVRTAFTQDGRIQLIQSFDGRRKTQSFDMECYAMPVLDMPKNIMIIDTSTAEAWT